MGFPCSEADLPVDPGNFSRSRRTAREISLQRISCHCTFSLEVTFLTEPRCELDGFVPLFRISNVPGEEKDHCVWHTLALSLLSSVLPIYSSCLLFLSLRSLGIIPALNSLPSDVFPNKASLCQLSNTYARLCFLDK